MFSGLGETTLDPHFERYLALAGSLGFLSICLFTNGHRLTREKARAWNGLGLSDVLVSLHGTEMGHDRSVGRSGSFDEGMRALDIYVSEGYRAAVNTCLTRYSLTEVVALRKRLETHPLKAHTLAFPEWSGAVLRHPDVQVTYDEVDERAAELLPADDGVTSFDNLPYCLVRRRIREANGVAPVAYLDGQGSVQLEPHLGKSLPDRCRTERCPLLPICPRFEKRYIEHHGWGRVLERVDALLDEIAGDTTVAPRVLASAGAPSSRSRKRPRTSAPPRCAACLSREQPPAHEPRLVGMRNSTLPWSTWRADGEAWLRAARKTNCATAAMVKVADSAREDLLSDVRSASLASSPSRLGHRAAARSVRPAVEVSPHASCQAGLHGIISAVRDYDLKGQLVGCQLGCQVGAGLDSLRNVVGRSQRCHFGC